MKTATVRAAITQIMNLLDQRWNQIKPVKPPKK